MSLSVSAAPPPLKASGVVLPTLPRLQLYAPATRLHKQVRSREEVDLLDMSVNELFPRARKLKYELQQQLALVRAPAARRLHT